jgi:hypothetical protein
MGVTTSLPLSRIWTYFLYSVIIVLVCYFALYTYGAYRSIAYPYSLDTGGEGFLLNQAYLWSQGHHPYHAISSYPYMAASYPPLYPLLCAGFIRLIGVDFSIGRAISFIAALLIAFILYRIAQDATKNRLLAIVSSLAFLATAPALTWTNLFRVDTLGLLFCLLGVYIVLRNSDSKLVYFSIPFFILAVYTKQSLIAAPIATIAFLALRDWRLGAKYSVTLVTIAGVLLVTATYLTKGEFLSHLFIYQPTPFSISRVWSLFLYAIRLHPVLIGFACFFIVLCIPKRAAALPFLKTNRGLIALYFVISALVALTAGKIGSSSNYTLEPLAVSCILFGLCLAQVRARIENNWAWTLIVGFLVTLQLFLLLPSQIGHLHKLPTQADVAAGDMISSYIRSTPGDILSEDAGYLVLNKRPVPIEPFVFTQLSNEGVWDQKGFLQDLQNRRFSLVILDFDLSKDPQFPDSERFTPEMIQEIRANYSLTEKIGDTYIYKPNAAP